MPLVRTILLALALGSAAASAEWINRAGEPLPDSDARKAVGAFGAQLIFVGDEGELFRRWNTPSESVNVETADTVRVNEDINAFVVFGGCARDAAGNCSVAMRFEVLRPDGAVYARTPPMEVWHGKPAPRGRSLGLSVEYLKIVIEPGDQLGNYEVRAWVRDNHSGNVLKLRGPFHAVEAD